MHVQLEDKDRHIEALSSLVCAAEEQTADAMALVAVLSQQRDQHSTSPAVATAACAATADANGQPPTGLSTILRRS